jgi:serine/threonine protein kinase
MGTPPYAAPEQLKGSLSFKTDVWGIGSVLHMMIHFHPPIQEPMVKTRTQIQKFNMAVEKELRRDAEEGLAAHLGLAGRMGYSWRARRDVPRQARECPTHYSVFLAKFLRGTLREEPATRLSISELFSSVPAHEISIREVMYSPLPTWFQIASRNSLMEAQRKQGDRRVPTVYLSRPPEPPTFQ